MKIAVCIKQVPLNTDVSIDQKNHTINRDSNESQINPYDLYAIEESMRIKEEVGGTVTVFSMGPPQADKSLKEALSYGLDKAVLITDPYFAGSDTLATSYILSEAIKQYDQFDIIIMGKQAYDGDTGQVGPGVSALLNLPHTTEICKVESITESFLIVKRLLTNGYLRLKIPVPCLFTVVKDINTPRNPSLMNILASKRASVDIMDHTKMSLDLSCIGLSGSPTEVVSIFTPKVNKDTKIIKESSKESVRQLFIELENRGVKL